MHLPGSRQLGLAKALFMKYPWQQFEPHPEWVDWSEAEKANQSSEQPQATGLSNEVRIVYVPRPKPVRVPDLGGIEWMASYFDPVTGETSAPFKVALPGDGAFICSPPAAVEHDWVLILDAAKRDRH